MAPASTAPPGAPTSTEFNGYEFSNNLFSDLAPLLTLFGEHVTKQFLSLTLGWADHILLAMGPLGIITIVISAIRVSGPKRLKAIIGRARENLTTAEVELLSSTSHDVCELWNGSQIIRTVGEPKNVKEFVFLKSNDGANDDSQLLDFKDAVDQSLLTADPRVSTEQLQILAGQSPNITLNVAGATSSDLELWAWAAMGLALQTAALIVTGLTVYSWKLQKGEETIATYGYPCFLSGSLAVIIGALGCSYVIEKRTKEITIRSRCGVPIRKVLQVQKACTVGDQHFRSYAIINEASDQVLRTSRLKAPHKGHWSFLAAASTFITIAGYIVQFVGLRALHWSATIIQLGVTLAMTCCRAWVRRGLASQPTCVPLEEAHEAECLTLLLVGDEYSDQTKEWNSKPNTPQIRSWELQNLDSSFKWQPTARPEIGVGDYKTSKIIQYYQHCMSLKSPSSSYKWSNRLCLAVGSIMKHITSSKEILIKPKGAIAERKTLSWRISTTRELPTAKCINSERVHHLSAGVMFEKKYGRAWFVKQEELQSIIELWVHSLNHKVDLWRPCPLPGGIFRPLGPSKLHRYLAFMGELRGDDIKKSSLENWIDTLGIPTSKRTGKEVTRLLRGGPLQLAIDAGNETSIYFQTVEIHCPVHQICALELLRLFLSAIFSEITAIKGETEVMFGTRVGFKAHTGNLDEALAPLWTNTAIRAIASCIVEARLLAFHHDATNFVVSALYGYNLLPTEPTIVTSSKVRDEDRLSKGFALQRVASDPGRRHYVEGDSDRNLRIVSRRGGWAEAPF